MLAIGESPTVCPTVTGSGPRVYCSSRGIRSMTPESGSPTRRRTIPRTPSATSTCPKKPNSVVEVPESQMMVYLPVTEQDTQRIADYCRRE